MSSPRPARRRSPPRRRPQKRGLVYVEALIVVAFVAMTFSVLVYFARLHTAGLAAARIARAKAMRHAIAACTGDPGAGLDGAIRGLESGGASVAGQSNGYDDRPVSTSGSTEAAGAVREGSQASGVEASPSGVRWGMAEVRATGRAASGGAGYSGSGQIAWASYVGCAERLPRRDGNLLRELFGNLRSYFPLKP